MSRCPEQEHPGRLGRRPVAAAALMVASLTGCSLTPAPPDDSTPEATVATTPVARQDLTTSESFEGMLGYGDVAPLAAGRDGMLTWMPEEGTVIRRGDIVAEINGTPTRLLYGERPAWRRLAVGEQDGPDIRQLNDNLAALGYAERDALPEERFDWRTREAVYQWQDDLGLRPTGVVELGDVMFLPSEIRVGHVETKPGTGVGAGQTLAQGTGTSQVITMGIDPASRGGMTEQSPVVINMPDRTQMNGVIHSIGRVVSGVEPDSEPTIEVEVVPVVVDSASGGLEIGGSGGAGDFEVMPVIVVVERVLAEDVLVVPVGALLASAEGGYVVERVTAGGTELVGVEPGRFADLLVEITGDIDEGDEVVVPSS